MSKNPHMILNNLGDGFWQCGYCGFTGTWAECHASACAHTYPPCETCGQTPQCAADCAAVWEILNDPSVYVVGGPDDS